MMKGLIATFMVALMLLTVLSGVVTVNAVSVSEEISEDNNDSGDSGFCSILYYIWYYNTLARGWYDFTPRITIVLEDLWTGEVQEKTGLFGLILFTNLRRGHDYGFTLKSLYWEPTWKIENLRIFTFSCFSIDLYE